ncbi:ethanolamine ammonia-lyase subunit EutC [Zavarzinella formosa]|uniref:ethanolamine ammonia-lyase subunit EutC n=1 Tax=Zavarzinella formosa TaxID=360055 RepID=UPI0002D803B5|nr:ethanolamine ammonia-lyase subunit EutC [Zavarzinella formosa]
MPLPDESLAEADLARLLQEALARTPARLMVGRAGPGYLTSTWLKLRADHAAARDAVHAEIDLPRDFSGRSFLELRTRACSKAEYLMRPDRGRELDDGSLELLRPHTISADVLFIIGDGLSAAAVRLNALSLLDSLTLAARERGWSVGPTCFVHHCRVGILNALGEALRPTVAVLLIGERPGLATAESLSAYLAHRPQRGHTDAQRNLISNIHANGVSLPDATARLIALIARMMAVGASGVGIKESLTVRPPPPAVG